MRKITKECAIDAADVLNDFIGDFITGVMVLREYSAQLKVGKLTLEMMVPIQKMCICNLVLAFAKFEEFWDHYHDVVQPEHREACKDILRAIRSRKISEFRNRVAGHIWNKETKRPLKHSEVMQALEKMTEPDFKSFLNWINNPKDNTYPTTVVSVMEAVRNGIVSAYGIKPEEIIHR